MGGIKRARERQAGGQGRGDEMKEGGERGEEERKQRWSGMKASHGDAFRKRGTPTFDLVTTTNSLHSFAPVWSRFIHMNLFSIC